jgi:hypothetical protein
MAARPADRFRARGVLRSPRARRSRASIRADELADRLPRQAWQRLSAGAGAKGQRWYDWAWVTIPRTGGKPPTTIKGNDLRLES